MFKMSPQQVAHKAQDICDNELLCKAVQEYGNRKARMRALTGAALWSTILLVVFLLEGGPISILTQILEPDMIFFWKLLGVLCSVIVLKRMRRAMTQHFELQNMRHLARDTSLEPVRTFLMENFRMTPASFSLFVSDNGMHMKVKEVMKMNEKIYRHEEMISRIEAGI